MTTPTITTVTPNAGWSAGRTLVEIRGTGFRTPTAFDYATSGRAPTPPPSLQVFFDGSAAAAVKVISPTLIRCLTPMHWPKGWFYEFENGRRVPAPPPSDKSKPPSGAKRVEVSGTVGVTVTNIDNDGVAIAGETVTKEDAYTFQRPRLDRKGTWDRAVTALVNALRVSIMDNVVDDADVDYDVDTGDVAGLTSLATLPGIAITQKVFSDTTDPLEQGLTAETGEDAYTILRRAPIYTDFSCRLILVSVDVVELRAIAQLVRDFFAHIDELRVAKDKDDASLGSYRVRITLDTQGIQETGRVGRTNLLMATAMVGIIGIPSEWDINVTGPGLSYDASQGKPHEGVLDITRPVATHNISRIKGTT